MINKILEKTGKILVIGIILSDRHIKIKHIMYWLLVYITMRDFSPFIHAEKYKIKR
jgi:hypothetical protein